MSSNNNRNQIELLNEAQKREWETIVKMEEELPKPKKGTKPDQETINNIRIVRERKRDFLDKLPDDIKKQLTATNVKSTDAPTVNNDKDLDRHNDMLQNLGNLRIKNATGATVELVDIGINTQSRVSGQEFERQLVRSLHAGVTRVLLTGCSLKSSIISLSMCQKYAKNKSCALLYCTAGIHPHDAKTLLMNSNDENSEIDQEKVTKLKSLIESPHNVAVGECGLDYDRMFSPRSVQQRVFRLQAEMAASNGKPLFVHLREKDAGPPIGALNDAMEILQSCKIDPSRVCIHCYTGEVNELRGLVQAGYMIGLTGFLGMEKRAQDTRAAIARGVLPLNRLMIETDAPFMMPDKSWFGNLQSLGKSRQNEACLLPAVCKAIAAYFDNGKYSDAELGMATTQNAIKFFNLEQVDSRCHAAKRVVPDYDKAIHHPASKKQQNSKPASKETDKKPARGDQDNKSNKKLSHTLSMILRHSAEKEGLKLRSDGYISLDQLKAVKRLSGFTLDDFTSVVKNCPKQRFSLIQEDGVWLIRANQGHSIAGVSTSDLLTPVNLLEIETCIHGTYHEAWEKIKVTGLSRMGRNHIHFAKSFPSKENEVISGMRSSCEVVIYLDTVASAKAGLEMFVSANGVLLTTGLNGGNIPCSLFQKVVDRRSGVVLYP